MTVEVTVSTNSSRQKIIPISVNSYKVNLVSRPVDNKANKELIKIMAKHFNTSPSRIRIIRGVKSKQKVLSIE